MAVNIFEKYGIKEVANVYFEALADDNKGGVKKGDIVLYLDTLKVSTIETAAENTSATGGWGNPKLITWDYGKTITVTLTDALISLESLRLMLGGSIKESGASQVVKVSRTEQGTVTLGTDSSWTITLNDHLDTSKKYTVSADGKVKTKVKSGENNTETDVELAASCKILNLTKGTRVDNDSLTNPGFGNGDVVRVFWTESKATEGGAVEISISPDTFPGTYKVVGDTFIRSQNTLKDEAFQFIINKAKVLSNVTITLEAEGDPSTFEMSLDVLRDDSTGESEMMKLVRY